MKKLLLFCLIIGTGLCVQAQDTPQKTNADSVLFSTGSDTVELKSYANRYDPRKAILYAAILPGMGQVYNKKYWKLPLVYGGFIGFGYGVQFYQRGYKDLKSGLFDLLESGDQTVNVLGYDFNEPQLRRLVDQYRRERDFFIILTAGMYLLQMVDAHVDAHLKEFDLNPNLQVRIEPSMNNDVYTGRTTGISLIIRF